MHRKTKNGKIRDVTIKVGKLSVCSNLKLHLERCHNEKWKHVKQADEEELCSKSKKKQQIFAKQPSIKSHFELNVTKSVIFATTK